MFIPAPRSEVFTCTCVNLTTGEVVQQLRTATSIWWDPVHRAYKSWNDRLRRIGFLRAGDRYRIHLRYGDHTNEPIPPLERFMIESRAR